jgi:hypothetical protein
MQKKKKKKKKYHFAKQRLNPLQHGMTKRQANATTENSHQALALSTSAAAPKAVNGLRQCISDCTIPSAVRHSHADTHTVHPAGGQFSMLYCLVQCLTTIIMDAECVVVGLQFVVLCLIAVCSVRVVPLRIQ